MDSKDTYHTFGSMSNVYFCFLSITEWNPDTIAKFGMVDFNNVEIISLERVSNDQDISL